VANIYFVSDTHFGHMKILEYCSRPFQDVAEMDASMIERWNSKVKPGDTVYHLGDFALVKDLDLIPKYARALNGQIHLIMGNHDQKREKGLKGFAEVKHYKEITIGEQKIVLLHYAMKVWNKSHFGSWQLHGHSHGSLPRDYTMKQLDVGVDCWNYAPISFEEVEAEMKKHTFVPVDHHRGRAD
jgi:calcineurin-like phosphoesterase family protein